MKFYAISLWVSLALAACGDDAGTRGGGSDVLPDVPDVPSPDTSGSDDSSEPAPDGAPSDDSAAPDGTPAEDTAEEELTLTEVSPGKGLTIGLEQVEMFGSGFFQGMQVFFGESLAQDIFVLNADRLVVLTPP